MLLVKRRRFFLIGLAAFFAARLYAQDDISVRAGEYEVFYSAFNTSFLSPAVASAIKVVRAKDRGLINVSVIKHFPSGETQSVAVDAIEGSTFNLLHRVNLQFQEVIEPAARYYLAEFSINNDDELIVVDLRVLPEGESKPIDISFQRQFYLNDS